MVVSPYFNNFPSQNRMTNEHMLMEDVIVESIQIMGHNVYFIPRESLDNVDMIFGETTKVKFHHAYQIEAYIANVEGFEGDSDFFSKFGLEIRNTSNFVLSRRSFDRIIPTSLRTRPQEGDLVWVPLFHKMFEIKFIESKLMFYSVGSRHPFVYEMRCEEFRYSGEEITTNVEEIDDVERENAYTIKLILDKTTGSGNFRKEDVVYQSPDGTWANNTAHAYVRDWYRSNGALMIFDVSGSFANNVNVYSNTSSTVYKLSGKDETTDYLTQDLANNDDFAEDNTLVLDLSQINPFGTP